MMMPLLQSLRDANCRLSFWIDGAHGSDGKPTVAAPEHMAALLSELLRAGADLRARPLDVGDRDSALDEELARYRSNVERLRDLLPAIHSQLLAERARLERQCARVMSAAEWARASRQTL